MASHSKGYEIKWTVSKSVTSDPLAANIFPLALVWSGGGEVAGQQAPRNISVNYEIKVVKWVPYKKQVSREGSIVIRKWINSIPALQRTKVSGTAGSLIP